MLVNLSKTHFGSLTQNIPEVKVKNLYVVTNPLSASEFSYVTRPVLQQFVSFTEGQNVRGLYYQQGFNNDKLLAVVNENLYSVNEDGTYEFVGFINGLGPCKFSSTVFGVGIVSGDYFYIYDADGLHYVEIPDGLKPSDITTLNNYLIVSIQNSNKFYWVIPGEITIDPLSFASAESNRDYIVSVKNISDELWIIGSETTEVWAPTADVDAPFNRISGRVFNQGCVDVNSACTGVYNSLPCVVWVSTAREVILAQGSPVKISNDYVEEVLRQSSYYYGWFFRKQRNDFYVISTDIITLVFDTSLGNWYYWNTHLKNFWDVSAGTQKGFSLFGFDLRGSNKLYKLVDGNKDGPVDWLVCEITGFIPHNNRQSLPCQTITVVGETGFSSSYLSEPTVELRWSDDQGGNWSTYIAASLGQRGQLQLNPEFRSLGTIRTPGRRIELRFSLAESFRLDYVILNKDV